MPNESSGNKNLADTAGVLPHTHLFQFLGARYTSAFSATCKEACDMIPAIRKKQALQSLLTAVVCGNEDLARKIVTSHPELLLDSTATVTDLSGKEIKGLTPLQAAICAGDVDMVQMIKEVLQQKYKDGTLSFDPELEIQSQFNRIYHNGDIDAVEVSQKTAAQKFQISILTAIFNAINDAKAYQVQYELDNPGQYSDSDLNAALHNFRTQFAITANSKQIFNPFYLLKAFDFFYRKFNNFGVYAVSGDQLNRRRLFWRQIIGYMQRHLPACYWQAYAQGTYYIINSSKKLKRDFEFQNDKGCYMRAVEHDLNNLGYTYAAVACGGMVDMCHGCEGVALGGDGEERLSKFIAYKKIRFTELTQPESNRQQPQSYLPTRCVIA